MKGEGRGLGRGRMAHVGDQSNEKFEWNFAYDLSCYTSFLPKQHHQQNDPCLWSRPRLGGSGGGHLLLEQLDHLVVLPDVLLVVLLQILPGLVGSGQEGVQ